jgi:nucleotidyltransferase/DNA polymerase involved in DNA repair
MDISGVDKLLGLPRDIGLEVKGRIRETIPLTCSIGIAPNKFLAKVASDMDKPDGLTRKRFGPFTKWASSPWAIFNSCQSMSF